MDDTRYTAIELSVHYTISTHNTEGCVRDVTFISTREDKNAWKTAMYRKCWMVWTQEETTPLLMFLKFTGFFVSSLWSTQENRRLATKPTSRFFLCNTFSSGKIISQHWQSNHIGTTFYSNLAVENCVTNVHCLDFKIYSVSVLTSQLRQQNLRSKDKSKFPWNLWSSNATDNLCLLIRQCLRVRFFAV